MRVENASLHDIDLGVKETFERSRIFWRKIGIYLGVAVGIFLLGLIPMAVKEWNTANQRDTARKELRLSTLQNTLSSAVIDSGRGDYEPARQTASDFFTALRTELEKDAGSDLSAKQRDLLRPLLGQRDEIITLLARSDPAAGARLSDLYVEFRQAMSTVAAVNH